jgi:hypothetical protein
VERDYMLANICADIGAVCGSRLVLKGGTLLRLCYFDDYRYSADLDFSAVDGLTATGSFALVVAATEACRRRIEAPVLEVSAVGGGTAWVAYIGPLGSRPRKVKLDVSDTELVEGHHRLPLQRRWQDLPAGAAVEGYTLEEVGAEKLRCIAERLQCRDLFDLHSLLAGRYVDPLETWHLYLRKAANDQLRSRQRTPPKKWADTFERRLGAYRGRWDQELGDYLRSVPGFNDVERQSRRQLAPVISAAQAMVQ